MPTLCQALCLGLDDERSPREPSPCPRSTHSRPERRATARVSWLCDELVSHRLQPPRCRTVQGWGAKVWGFTVGLQATCPLRVAVCTAGNWGEGASPAILRASWRAGPYVGACSDVRGGLAAIRVPVLHVTPHPGSFWKITPPSPEFLGRA